jgi:hypothetical protein
MVTSIAWSIVGFIYSQTVSDCDGNNCAGNAARDVFNKENGALSNFGGDAYSSYGVTSSYGSPIAPATREDILQIRALVQTEHFSFASMLLYIIYP